MTNYVVTTANWNDPSFWSSISESSAGHSNSFANLPSNFSIELETIYGLLVTSDGASSFSVGEAAFRNDTDATLGGTSDWDFFDTIIGSEGDDFVEGRTGGDRCSGGGDDDYIDGDPTNDDFIDLRN